MAKKKAGGKTTQHVSPTGKRLGVQVTAGKKVSIGSILVRQRGKLYGSGKGTDMGRDHTIFSVVQGTVKFGQKFGKKVVEVLSE